MGKDCSFSNTCQPFSFCQNIIFERFFYHNTIPVGFYCIFTYILHISLCKTTQLQESEMKPTGWTLSYLIQDDYFILQKRSKNYLFNLSYLVSLLFFRPNPPNNILSYIRHDIFLLFVLLCLWSKNVLLKLSN